MPTLGEVSANLQILPSDELLTTKGDVIVFDGTIGKRLAVGTIGQALIADSTKPLGVSWADVGGGGPHTHPETDIIGLTGDLAGKAALSHTHAESNIVGLTGDLAGKASLSHAHGATDITSGTIATARLGGGTPDATTFLRGDQTWAAPGGGSDPWTYRKLAANFLTSSATAVTVAGLSFTATAGNDYEFQARLLLRTTAAATNPRVGLGWATGLSDGIAVIQESQTATGTPLFASGNPNAALLVAVGGLPNATQSWPARIDGFIRAGASPGGTMNVQLASETAGTTVSIVAGSYIAYRIT